MRNLKLLILLFGALGLVSLLMDFETLKLGLKHDTANYAMVLAGFAVPVIVALLAIARPPMQAWHAAAALAGFALVAVKFRIWKMLPHIGDIDTAGKLGVVATVGGVVVALLAVIKPESRS